MMVMFVMIRESIMAMIMFIMLLKVMMMMIAMIREHDAGDAHVNDQQEDGPLSNDLSRPDGRAELRCPRLHRQL